MSERAMDNNRVNELADRLAQKALEMAKAENEEERRKQKKRIIKILLLLLLIVLILIFASIAWFALNKTVGANTMAVSPADSPFELETVGYANNDYIDLFNMADSEYEEGAQQGSTNAYRTGSAQQIRWRLDSDDDDSYTEGFRPGASGSLTFKVVPKGVDSVTVNCKFNIRAFVGNYNDTTGDLESIDEVTSATTDNDQKDACNYINGHILFFENKTTVSGNDVYSGYIGADGLNVTATGGNAQTVTVYWKWVNTFDQMVLKSTDNYNDFPLIADSGEAAQQDRDALIAYIKANYPKIFSGLSSEDQASIASITYNNLKNSALLSTLCDTYNAADQIIGVNLDYFMLELTADVGTSSNN
ncbi:MAG: hypothetical protein J5956_10470 [Ruminococcus sp.]|nr:hypothetical protein [Ruminococcus sp.]